MDKLKNLNISSSPSGEEIITYKFIKETHKNTLNSMTVLHQEAWQLFQESLSVWLNDTEIIKRIQIEKTKYGKPYLKPPYQNIKFNLTHSEEIVACILTKNYEVGIDAEKIRPFYKNTLKKIATLDEQTTILNAKEPNIAFWKLWTFKESIVKAEGVGLSGLKEIQVNSLKYNINQIKVNNYIISICRLKYKGE